MQVIEVGIPYEINRIVFGYVVIMPKSVVLEGGKGIHWNLIL